MNRVNVEKILRKVETESCVLNNIKRVVVFKAKNAYSLLKKSGFNEDEIKKGLECLLDEGIIFKVSVDDKNAKIVLSKDVTIEDEYIWEKENYSIVYLILTLISLVCVSLMIFTIYFPNWYKYTLYYMKYPLLGFLGFLLVAGVVRWIVFLITLVLYESQLWIWPNLFADCGFIESFIPLYEWVGPETKNE
ncbi:SEC62 [Hepatospora eriocheir]|uniref:Translocation protein SEC62 n=1 Tax=Hepatospora eriocheir TaxID=1081669 RepID=A0A1X0QBX7_9MICR|nr:SEC62 [Hepatospora eriocheir]